MDLEFEIVSTLSQPCHNPAFVIMQSWNLRNFEIANTFLEFPRLS